VNERIENKMDQVAVLEAVLFASGDPVSLDRLSRVLDMEIAKLKSWPKFWSVI
jgi:chromosome segregation and condensation protein ScpB